jgi:hypothetical protein
MDEQTENMRPGNPAVLVGHVDFDDMARTHGLAWDDDPEGMKTSRARHLLSERTQCSCGAPAGSSAS